MVAAARSKIGTTVAIGIRATGQRGIRCALGLTRAQGRQHPRHTYHEEELSKRGGAFQMAQLWVNLPRRHKMSEPGYQAISADSMGVVTLPNDAGTVRILAGELGGVVGPAKTFTPMNVRRRTTQVCW